MKNIASILLIILVFAPFGCKKISEPYSFYRDTRPKNFLNIDGGELYSYASSDVVILLGDRYFKMQGSAVSYGDTIIHYGHCWSPTNRNPVIGVDTLMTRDPEGAYRGADSMSFVSPVVRLNPETKYYIRSYIITDKDTGYNPIVTEVTTKRAINEWKKLEGDIGVARPGTKRFDALCFNFGDTVIFGGGNSGNELLLNSMWIYDPDVDLWKGDFPALPLVSYYPGESGRAFTDGIGFAVEFKAPNLPGPAKCIYVGLGDYKGKNIRNDKSMVIREYDFTYGVGNWSEDIIFPSSRRCGSVCFVIKDRAYVGTGHSEFPLNDWWVFEPSREKDGNPETDPWRQVLTNNPTTPRYGAVAFTLNGRGYFGLGRDNNGNFLNDFWEYRPSNTDPTGGAWNPVANFPGLPRTNAVAFVIGDMAYVGSGDNIIGDFEDQDGNYSGEIFSDFYRYDPYLNKWTRVADYTTNISRTEGRKITRAAAYSSQKDKLGYVGFGYIPVPYPYPEGGSNGAQEEIWYYQPF